jgi:hypothetical protein
MSCFPWAFDLKQRLFKLDSIIMEITRSILVTIYLFSRLHNLEIVFTLKYCKTLNVLVVLFILPVFFGVCFYSEIIC